MPSTNRIHLNRATTPIISQSQKLTGATVTPNPTTTPDINPNDPTLKNTGKGKTSDGDISLVLFSNEKGSRVGSVDLTGAEFDALNARAKNLNISLDKMLRDGFHKMLEDVNWDRCFSCVRGNN